MVADDGWAEPYRGPMVLGSLVKATASVVHRRRTGLTILVYHRVGGGTPSAVDLPVARFRDQMAELAGRVVALDEAVDALRRGEPLDGSVVVTFDDGTADFVDRALPVLVDLGVPVTLYVATRHIDEHVPFPRDAPPASWTGLREAVTTGLVTVGSHTHSHLLLDRAPPRQVADELDRSRALIEHELGVPAHHFAYPKAVAGSPAAERLVRDRFDSAALAGTRPNRPGDDLHRLARSPIQRADEMRYFRVKAAGGMGLEDDLRRVLNRVRYRDAVS